MKPLYIVCARFMKKRKEIQDFTRTMQGFKQFNKGSVTCLD